MEIFNGGLAYLESYHSFIHWLIKMRVKIQFLECAHPAFQIKKSFLFQDEQAELLRLRKWSHQMEEREYAYTHKNLYINDQFRFYFYIPIVFHCICTYVQLTIRQFIFALFFNFSIKNVCRYLFSFEHLKKWRPSSINWA